MISMEYTCDDCKYSDPDSVSELMLGATECPYKGICITKKGYVPTCWTPCDESVEKTYKNISVNESEEVSRASILNEAKKCVCGQREQDYGSPEDNFITIALLWTAYKGVNFTAVDVSMMMSLLKIARISTGTATKDSFVDLAGYAACGGEIRFKEENK